MKTKLRITQPVAEPVTLAEAKLHLRVDHAHEDALISGLIAAARQACEHEIGRSLGASTWEMVLPRFESPIALDFDTTAVTWVRHLDLAGAQQELQPAAYRLDATGQLWPTAQWPQTAAQTDAVRVRYVAGFAGPVPQALRAWLLLHVGHLYANRELATTKLEALPFAAGLLDPFRVYA